MSKKKNTHGGKRAGAGRPELTDTKRVRMNSLVSPTTKQTVIEAAESQGISHGRVLDNWAKKHAPK